MCLASFAQLQLLMCSFSLSLSKISFTHDCRGDSSFAYYVGFSNGLYYMYPSSDYESIFVDYKMPAGACAQVS